jgi:hypothetical protein
MITKFNGSNQFLKMLIVAKMEDESLGGGLSEQAARSARLIDLFDA